MTESKPNPTLQKQIDENLKSVYRDQHEVKLAERFKKL